MKLTFLKHFSPFTPSLGTGVTILIVHLVVWTTSINAKSAVLKELGPLQNTSFGVSGEVTLVNQWTFRVKSFTYNGRACNVFFMGLLRNDRSVSAYPNYQGIGLEATNTTMEDRSCNEIEKTSNSEFLVYIPDGLSILDFKMFSVNDTLHCESIGAVRIPNLWDVVAVDKDAKIKRFRKTKDIGNCLTYLKKICPLQRPHQRRNVPVYMEAQNDLQLAVQRGINTVEKKLHTIAARKLDKRLKVGRRLIKTVLNMNPVNFTDKRGAFANIFWGARRSKGGKPRKVTVERGAYGTNYIIPLIKNSNGRWGRRIYKKKSNAPILEQPTTLPPAILYKMSVKQLEEYKKRLRDQIEKAKAHSLKQEENIANTPKVENNAPQSKSTPQNPPKQSGRAVELEQTQENATSVQKQNAKPTNTQTNQKKPANSSKQKGEQTNSSIQKEKSANPQRKQGKPINPLKQKEQIFNKQKIQDNFITSPEQKENLTIPQRKPENATNSKRKQATVTNLQAKEATTTSSEKKQGKVPNPQVKRQATNSQEQQKTVSHSNTTIVKATNIRQPQGRGILEHGKPGNSSNSQKQKQEGKVAKSEKSMGKSQITHENATSQKPKKNARRKIRKDKWKKPWTVRNFTYDYCEIYDPRERDVLVDIPVKTDEIYRERSLEHYIKL